MKDIRLLPLVIVATCALLALKGFGLVMGEVPVLGGAGPVMAQDSAQADAAGTDIGAAGVGDAAAPEAGTGTAGGGTVDDVTDAGNTAAPSLLDRVLGRKSGAREALLENLAERREQLDARDRELDLRENLLKAAEQRVEKRIAELKELEALISAADEQRRAEEAGRMKALVTMYENMKPKDAARIFNRLDMSVVVKVAGLMSARQMSAVLAEMESEVAQRLTLELSADPTDPLSTPDTGADLPKIIGTRPAD